MGSISNKVKGMKDYTKEWATSLAGFEGYALYFVDSKHMEARLRPLMALPKIIKNKKTGERWVRGDSAFQIYGKPVYACFPEIPYTVGLEVDIVLLKEKMKEAAVNQAEKLLDAEYTSEELDIIKNVDYSAAGSEAWAENLYTNSILKKGLLDNKYIIIMLMSNVVSILATALMFVFAWGNPFNVGPG